MQSAAYRKWQEAREAFGDMLLLWRSQNGWAGQTAEDWARACPELLPFKILNSTWTGLELKRNERTAPATFRALGDVMQALDLPEDQRGMIRDRRLRDRVYGAEPIRHPDGRAWDHVDFYRAFWGEIEIPARYGAPEPTMTVEEADAWSRQWRAEFRKVLTQRGIRPRDALAQVLRELSPAPTAEDVATLEDLTFGFAGLAPEQSNLRAAADGALRRWRDLG